MDALTGGWVRIGQHPALYRWTGSDPDPRVVGLFAWLPPGARPGAAAGPGGARYPVVYWLDGAAIHQDSPTSMRIPDALTSLAREGIEVIAVGIGSGTTRFHDYSPSALVRAAGARGGGVGSFGRIVARRVVPLVDASLPTMAIPAARTIVGSSIGAVAAIQIALANPDLFDNVIAHSPSLWATAGVTHRAARRAARSGRPRGRMWIDAGDREVVGSDRWSAIFRLQAQRLLSTTRRELGPDRVGGLIEVGGLHEDRVWGDRLPQALRFVLAGSPTTDDVSGDDGGHGEDGERGRLA